MPLECRAGSGADGEGQARRGGVRHQVLRVARCLRGGEGPLLPARLQKRYRAGPVSPAGISISFVGWFVRPLILQLLHGGVFTTRSISVDQRNTVPQVRNVEINADKSIKDPQGNPLPPCIVMERGESLDIWSERAKPDRSQAFMVRL